MKLPTIARLAAAVTLAVALASCGTGTKAPRAALPAPSTPTTGSVATAQPRTHAPATPNAGLTDLSSVDQLGALFDRDTGMPRLILLLSPT